MSSSGGRISRRRFLESSAGALTLGGLISACGGGSSASSGGTGTPATAAGDIDSLVLIIPNLSDRMDPTATAFNGLATILPALEPIVTWTPEKGLAPQLAESFKLEGGNRRWRYRLRKGVKFWDGSPLTVEDVIYSFQLHMGKGNESFIAQQWDVVDTIRKTGADEITVTLKHPDPLFAYTPAETGIVQKAYHSKHLEQIGSPQALNMGTGPYKLDSFEPQKGVTWVRNEQYWGKKPAIKKLEARLVSDNATRLLALQSGDADGIIAIPLAQVEAYEKIQGLEVSSVLDPSIYKFSFDFNKEPWGSDLHLRKAFAHCINGPEMAKGVLKGNVEDAVSAATLDTFSQLMSAAEIAKAKKRLAALRPAYDLDAAKREMAMSTVPNGISTTMLTIGSDPSLASMIQFVAQSAKQVGIDMKLREVDDETYFNAVYFKQTTEGLSIDNSGMDRPDPASEVDIMYNPDNAKPGGSGVNTASYKNPEIAKLLEKQSLMAPDDPKRAGILIEVEEVAAKDVPYALLNHPKIFLGLASDYAYKGFNAFYWMNRWFDHIHKAA